MYLHLLIKGILLGFSIAAPVGPIGVLCVRRTLAQGRVSGMLSGLGVATADAIYGFLAAFGVTAVTNLLVAQKFWISLIGGLFLCYLGLTTLLSRPSTMPKNVSGTGLWRIYLSTFFLTLTNPMTIISFMAVFAGLGIGSAPGKLAPVILVLGVFTGSALWWYILSTGVHLFRERFDPNRLRWVNIISGVILLVFGALALTGSL